MLINPDFIILNGKYSPIEVVVLRMVDEVYYSSIHILVMNSENILQLYTVTANRFLYFLYDNKISVKQEL